MDFLRSFLALAVEGSKTYIEACVLKMPRPTATTIRQPGREADAGSKSAPEDSVRCVKIQVTGATIRQMKYHLTWWHLHPDVVKSVRMDVSFLSQTSAKKFSRSMKYH